MKPQIAIFGSAFNPPTLGHLSVLERLSQFDKVLVLPSYAHAWGKVMLDYELRCELISTFIKDSQLSNLELCQIEQEIAVRGQTVTTFDVMSQLQLRYPNANLTFVIGPDNLLNFSKFYRSEEILKRWQILACPETVSVRSTQIREYLEEGRAISHLTTENVAKLLNSSRFDFTSNR
ncbi:TPA: nicotinate-nicotinamide nucleotide adenylyltransferase [Photobacterium damselae]|uniref:nicotinate-nicotinamide nucleotide adenylyltransferase n=1 Tax=Photobacterium damselae TaxID=38293 RepID=UPI001EDD2834|nr:nicotinate-nicotinamide nucleotide adenylyltransferase [Photobacterium damselae]MCG3824669.1 nicotinate-nicotinamide nucleotide adenylyltransferase [Photobacterium damselae]